MRSWLAIAVLLTACGIPKGAEKTLVFGHGGMGSDHAWPMDSRGSLEACLSRGSDGVEMDVQLTADHFLIAYHDEDLAARTTCAEKVNSHTWAELQACRYPVVQFTTPDASVAFRPGLLLLDTLFMQPRAQYFAFDVKLFAAGEWNAYLDAFILSLKALIERHALQGRVNVECMDVDFLDRVKDHVPGVNTFYYATQPEEGLAMATGHGFSGITIDRSLIDADQVNAAHATGLKVAVFGARGDWSHRSALRLGADMIQTDDPVGLLRMLGR